jgi:uroporphyrinogen-III synthase
LHTKIESTYHGILFFSPSAVESFSKIIRYLHQLFYFAIGNTTANTIRKFTKNKVITSDAPGKDNLVKKMIEYFTG